jgi:hypothetical protein
MTAKPKTLKVTETFRTNAGKTVDVRIGTALVAADGSMVVAFDCLPRSLTIKVSK